MDYPGNSSPSPSHRSLLRLESPRQSPGLPWEPTPASSAPFSATNDRFLGFDDTLQPIFDVSAPVYNQGYVGGTGAQAHTAPQVSNNLVFGDMSPQMPSFGWDNVPAYPTIDQNSDSFFSQHWADTNIGIQNEQQNIAPQFNDSDIALTDCAISSTFAIEEHWNQPTPSPYLQAANSEIQSQGSNIEEVG